MTEGNREDTKAVSFNCPVRLLEKFKEYEDLGITSSRSETIALLVEVGLEKLGPKLPELAQAAGVLNNLKKELMPPNGQDENLLYTQQAIIQEDEENKAHGAH